MICNGQIQLECEGCDCKFRKLLSKTIIQTVQVPTITDLQSALQGIVDGYEANGYTVLAHSLVDVGAGWMVGLSVGYYEGDPVPTP